MRYTKYSFVMIVLVTGILILYFIGTNQKSKINHKAPEKSQNSSSGIGFKAGSPDLTGVNLNHGPYYIKADEMEETSGKVYFKLPQVKLMIKHVDWLCINSRTAKLATKDNHLELFDDIKADLNKNYHFKGNQVEIFEQKSIIQSDILSYFYTEEYSLESKKGFIIDYNKQVGTFHGEIDANIKRKADKEVTNIKSNSLEVIWLEKVGHFIGNVVLIKQDTKIKADKMIAFLNHKTDQLEKVLAYGNVKIINKEQTATSDFGEYLAQTEILTLKQNVKLLKGNDVASGELLHYNFTTKKADLVGAANQNTKTRVKAVITPQKKK